MSQVSCGDLSFLDPLLNLAVQFVEAAAQWSVVENFNGNDLGEAGAQDAVKDPRTKQRGSPTLPRHLIAVGPGNSFDQTVQAQPAQVVGHLAWGHGLRGLAQQGSPMVSQV